MVIITNFQPPKEIEDLADRLYNNNGYTSLEILLTDAIDTSKTEWTVDKECKVGDTVLFMCAKTAKDHIAHVCAEAKKLNDNELINFAEEERKKYNSYAGHLLAVGMLEDLPFQDVSDFPYQGWKSPWYGKICDLKLFDHPVSIDDFRDFINISRTGSITKLTNEQWSQLKQVILNNGNIIRL
ncbi:MAG: hypothetical protein MJ132_05215 [Clostridia bacterium]|nr:hypothetical protein [Clostridia bacterium]